MGSFDAMLALAKYLPGCRAEVALRLPLAEEGEDIFRGHGAGGFEFAVLLGEEELAVGIEDGDGRNAAIERNFVFFDDVEILVHFTDVDMDDKEGFVKGRSNFRGVQSLLEDVTIEAPVATEDHEDASMAGGGGVQGFTDFLGGIGVDRVEVFPLERLAETCRIGALRQSKKPAVALMEPALGQGNVFMLGSGAGLVGEGDLQDQDMKIGLRIVLLEDFRGKVSETFGLEGRPEGDLVGKRDGVLFEVGDFGRGRLGVQGLESGGFAGKDGRAPLVEGWKGGS
jgi:hypothetical protein